MMALQTKDDDGRDQEQLVRERIEDGAEFGFLVEVPGDIAIDAVGAGGKGESENGADAEFFLAAADIKENLDNKQRHQQNPPDGDFVGQCHSRV
jgi:hypothetical protein